MANEGVILTRRRGGAEKDAEKRRLRRCARSDETDRPGGLSYELGISSTWATNWNDPSYSITDILTRA